LLGAEVLGDGDTVEVLANFTVMNWSNVEKKYQTNKNKNAR
jgi:hypothetical protein